jgi:hypothetical protein
MAWIELHDTLRGHPKTYALADSLKIPQFAAVGLLTCLWTWALNNAPDGDLSQFPKQAVARECYWNKSADALLDALIGCGWVDDALRIHDWDDYAGRLLDKREQNKERVRKSRARNANVTHNESITDDARYGATVPNRTVPYLTVPNTTIRKDEREKRARFTPPSLDDVSSYCKDRNNPIDAQTFIDFYASKGWKIGNQPMKDWKAAVRTWEKRDNYEDKSHPNSRKHKTVIEQQYTQRDYGDQHTGLTPEEIAEAKRYE